MKHGLLTLIVIASPLAAHAAGSGGPYSPITDGTLPTLARVGPTVLLEGYGGYNWIDSNDLDQDEAREFWLYGGWAGINIPVIDAFGVQLDLFGEHTSTNESLNQDNYIWSAGVGAHAYWRDPSRGLLGIMGAGFYEDSGNSDDDSPNHARAWLVGLESQAYWGMTTLYGQAGYATYTNRASDLGNGTDNDYFGDGVFLRGVLRHFLSDRTKLEGELGGLIGDIDPDDHELAIVNWALEAEHAFMGDGAGSIFIRYEGIYADQEGVAGGNDDHYSLDSTIKLGFRVRFGGAGNSLLVNDRQGVSLDLPDVGRWGGITNGAIE